MLLYNCTSVQIKTLTYMHFNTNAPLFTSSLSDPTGSQAASWLTEWNSVLNRIPSRIEWLKHAFALIFIGYAGGVAYKSLLSLLLALLSLLLSLLLLLLSLLSALLSLLLALLSLLSLLLSLLLRAIICKLHQNVREKPSQLSAGPQPASSLVHTMRLHVAER